ncbi:hypothetical protein [Moorena sp. SIO3H5]|uniref:hypothetical protein n=1 Tax=Moorena sp. SIO3H5 TaxID=2607834 RepID=UPI0013B93061|nr:hypothetical protein [Moorena sp. SIO3H5]NEO72148.1 hypothetical protein [Moorena sp. SIO3H5]
MKDTATLNELLRLLALILGVAGGVLGVITFFMNRQNAQRKKDENQNLSIQRNMERIVSIENYQKREKEEREKLEIRVLEAVRELKKDINENIDRVISAVKPG